MTNESNIFAYLKNLSDDDLLDFLFDYYKDRIHGSFRMIGMERETLRLLRNHFGNHVYISVANVDAVLSKANTVLVIVPNTRNDNGLYHIKCKNFFMDSYEVEPLYKLNNRLRKYKLQKL
jgi:hypothetical protein